MSQVSAHRRDPLRTYQFRLALLDPPADSADEALFAFNQGAVQDTAAVTALSAGTAYVAGLQKCSGLSVSIGAHEVWEGGNSLHRYANPDKATWEPITLEQGLALDATLQTWAEAALGFLRTGYVSADRPVKRNVIVDVWDPVVHPGWALGERQRRRSEILAESEEGFGGMSFGTTLAEGGSRLQRFIVYNAWISRYQALPQLDAMASEVGIVSVELTHEGFKQLPEAELPTDLAPRRN